tara:strand:+ start:1991 stop:2842 length:852 start_codon:yes stop_codon:yes gene_type:complete
MLEDIGMFTRSRDEWVGNGTSFGAEKQNWKDMPSNIGKFLTSFNSNWGYVSYVKSKPSRVATGVAEEGLSVKEIDEAINWFIEHSNHVFTYFHDGDYIKRWRVSTKPNKYKYTNWNAKGLANTIQNNRFYLNMDAFQLMSEWVLVLKGMLPQAKMDALNRAEQQRVDVASSYNDSLVKATHKLDAQKLRDEILIQVKEVFKDALSSWNMPTTAYKLLKDESPIDFVKTLVQDDEGMVTEKKADLRKENKAILSNASELLKAYWNAQALEQEVMNLFGNTEEEE